MSDSDMDLDVPRRSLAERRLSSPVFSKLPLFTNILTSGKDENLEELKSAWPEYQPLITRFLAYERRLLGLDGDYTASQEMRELLKVEIKSGQVELEVVAQAHSRTNWNATQQGRLCSLLTLHRLLDTMAFLKNIGERAPPLNNRDQMPIPDSPPGLDDLKNWPWQALKFRKFLNKVLQSSSTVTERSSHSSRLLRFLSANSSKVLQAIIISNLTAASTYLSYMREFRLREGRFPDLPDQINDEIIKAASSNEEREFLEELREFALSITSSHNRTKSGGGGVSLASFRAVLQAAVLVSPAILISSKLLAKKSWNKNSLLLTAQCLGNDKPPELLQTEKILFEVVFAMADGTLLPDDALARLENDLPWQVIESIASANDSGSWFDLHKLVEISAPAEVDRNTLAISDEASRNRPHTITLSEAQDSRDEEAENTGMRVDDMGSAMPTGPVGENKRVASDNSENVADNVSSSFDADPLPAIDKTSIPIQGNNVTAQDHAIEGQLAPLENLKDMTLSSGAEQLRDSASANHPLSSNDGCPDISVEANDGMDTSSMDGIREGSTLSEDSLSSTSSRDKEEVEEDLTSDGMAVDEDGIQESGSEGGEGEDSTMGREDEDDEPASTRRSARIEKLILEKNMSTASPPSTNANPLFPKPKKKGKKKPTPPATQNRNNDSNHTDPGSQLNPIDVDVFSIPSSWEPDNLDAFREVKEENNTGKDKFKGEQPKRAKRYKCGRHYIVFDGYGTEVILEPEFHFPDYVKRFEEIMSGIEESYINGKPLHTEDPSRSIVAVISYEDYLAMSIEDLHNLLVEKNIIVRGCPTPDHRFDERGLNFIHPLHSTVPLQDYSLPGRTASSPESETSTKRQDFVKEKYFDAFDKEGKHIPATVDGTLQELLDEVRCGSEGRILNALDLPLCHENTAPTTYSTDRHAWHYTRGRPGFPSSETFPTTDTCWALAGGPNTITFFHEDSDGFNSRGVVYWGGKLWIFYRESADSPVSSRHVFFDDGFRLDRFLPIANYGLEAVFLTKGDFLLMRANQPHAVYGKEATIIHGGHFYLTSLMEKTAQSIIHSFVMDQFLTNTVHYRSRLLLQRIIDFYRLALLEKKFVDPEADHHIPDVQTFSGLINLLSLCNLVILGNVLDFRTYSAPNQKAEKSVNPRQRTLMERYDRTNISKQERVSMMYARGIALELVDWIRKFCVITSPKGEVVDDLPSEYLSRQMAALLKYKDQAERHRINGAPHCTLDLLKRQINNIIACDKRLQQYWSKRPKDYEDSDLGFGSQDGYSLRWEEDIVRLKTYEQLLQDGTTPLDKLWKKGEEYRSQQDEKLALPDRPPTVDYIPVKPSVNLSSVDSSDGSSSDSSEDPSDDAAEPDDNDIDGDLERPRKRVRR